MFRLRLDMISKLDILNAEEPGMERLLKMRLFLFDEYSMQDTLLGQAIKAQLSIIEAKTKVRIH